MTALPPGLLLLDTGIYIRFFRGEKYSWLGDDPRIFQRTILTAVVASELYAGTRDRRQKNALDQLWRAHDALGHFSTPLAETWIEAGILLRRAQKSSGRMDFAHHFRDLLTALEAARNNATLVTENAAHFARWRSLLASARQSLSLFHPR